MAAVNCSTTLGQRSYNDASAQSPEQLGYYMVAGPQLTNTLCAVAHSPPYYVTVAPYIIMQPVHLLPTTSINNEQHSAAKFGNHEMIYGAYTSRDLEHTNSPELRNRQTTEASDEFHGLPFDLNALKDTSDPDSDVSVEIIIGELNLENPLKTAMLAKQSSGTSSVDQKNKDILSLPCNDIASSNPPRTSSPIEASGSSVQLQQPTRRYNTPHKFGYNNNYISSQQFERAARKHRRSAASNLPALTWIGSLPPRNFDNPVYSCKVFFGGVPWDITEDQLKESLAKFGRVEIEFPSTTRCLNKRATHEGFNHCQGHLYAIFENDERVREMLDACTKKIQSNGIEHYYFTVYSIKRKSKQVQVIPWSMHESNYVSDVSHPNVLDHQTTIFVGALHGMLNAQGLAAIMNDLFGEVTYAGVDTDRYKYPIGSGRVTFKNYASYLGAVAAGIVQIQSAGFCKKIQIDPYLEKLPCSNRCGEIVGTYFCRNFHCMKYFCGKCWNKWHHKLGNFVPGMHIPLMRNPKTPTSGKKLKNKLGNGNKQKN